MVLTFDPHPARVLAPDQAPRALMSVEQKAEVLSSLGVERVVALSFTPELSRKSPEEFAALVLRDTVGAALVAVGPDFRFGRGRAGDLETLKRLGPPLGFAVEPVPSVLHAGVPISSTRIREAGGRGGSGRRPPSWDAASSWHGQVVRGRGGGASGHPDRQPRDRQRAAPAPGRIRLLVRVDRKADPQGCGQTSERPPSVAAAAPWRPTPRLPGRPLRPLLALEFDEALREERKFEDAAALVSQIGEDVVARPPAPGEG